MTNHQSNSSGFARQVGLPIFWGGALWVGANGLLHQAAGDHPLLARYLWGHPVEYAATLLFCVAVASLLIKLWAAQGQWAPLRRIDLQDPMGGGTAEGAESLLGQLDGLPRRDARSLLAGRLRSALSYIAETGSAEDLDDRLERLAAREADRLHDSYALPRLAIWAIPMLGFLGTVIGITISMGTLDFKALMSDAEASGAALTAGLALAFDTTTSALALSIVLMFCQFFTERVESQLNEAIENRAEEELIGRFDFAAPSRDPVVQSLQRAADRISANMENLVRRQAEIWQATIDTAHQRWSSLTGAAQATLTKSLVGALEESVRLHAAELAKTETAVADRHAKYAETLAESLSQATHTLGKQQERIASQGETLAQAITATADVIKLEDALNHNLQSLQLAGRFEETLVSLSAAIQLLAARSPGAGLAERKPAEARAA